MSADWSEAKTAIARLVAPLGIWMAAGWASYPYAMDFIVSYQWPGNVRELENWIQFALIKCRGAEIRPEHFPLPQYRLPLTLPPPAGVSAPLPPTGRKKLDVQSVQGALREAGGNKARAAQLLGVSRATLYRFFDENPPAA